MIATCISGFMSMNLTFYGRSVPIYSVESYNKCQIFICTTLAD